MVKEWLYQTLSKDHVVTRSPRSYNSQVGVPLSLWLLDAQTQVAVFEAGISQPGEMQVLHDIIRPTLGVLTMIGEAHQENFPSIEAKCQEKLRLFEGTEALVYPQDDPLVAPLCGRVRLSGPAPRLVASRCCRSLLCPTGGETAYPYHRPLPLAGSRGGKLYAAFHR